VLSGPPQGLTLDVRTDRGCGAAAVYQTGETVRITLTSNQTTNAQLTLTRPDGTVSALFNDVLQAGVARVINGVAGGTGVRTLTLSEGTTTATCAFSVGTVTPPPPGPAQRVLGILSSNETQEAVTAPTTAQVGVPFTVTIITSGGGCEEKGDEGVIVADNGATIMVYDLTTATRPGVLCTTIFKQFTHTVNLSFPQPGEKLIQVWGRRTGPGLPAGGVPIVVERRVLVQ
jgi:hypothetical protein